MGSLLGLVIREQYGQEAFDLVEETRASAKARRAGEVAETARLLERMRRLPLDSKRVLIKAFANYFLRSSISQRIINVYVAARTRSKLARSARRSTPRFLT
ncbi:MAG: hypothetical protein HND48_06935 [Chloroflexi bacterium]|nr:hypothetical protein [Chloroflexota bacterium]